MKYTTIVLIWLALSCNIASSQNPSEEMSEDKEYYEILKKAEEARQKNKLMMDSVDKKTSHIITKTSEQIVSLKQEVKELKQELNETAVKPSNGGKFKLLPIANDTENK